MEKGKKIGIMGGTFDPIHNGHLSLAQSAWQQFGLDKVLFMPSGISYMKENVLNPQKRVDMVALAIKGRPFFELSLIEVQKTGNTYTYETLETLTASGPDSRFYFIMGADSLFQIEQWKHPERIFKLASLICTVRDDLDLDAIKEKGRMLAQKGADVLYLDIPRIAISSTEIRDRVRRGLSIAEYVPQAVADHIRQEHLYYEED